MLNPSLNYHLLALLLIIKGRRISRLLLLLLLSIIVIKLALKRSIISTIPLCSGCLSFCNSIRLSESREARGPSTHPPPRIHLPLKLIIIRTFCKKPHHWYWHISVCISRIILAEERAWEHEEERGGVSD